MEELIKYCSMHKCPINFDIKDNKYIINFFMTSNNYNTLAYLYRELDYLYLCSIDASIEYDHNLGIRLRLNVSNINDKEELFKNIIILLEEPNKEEYIEKEYEYIYIICNHLKKIGVNRIIFNFFDYSYNMSIIHHKNIQLPQIILEDEGLIKEEKDNYVKDSIYFLEEKELEEIINNINEPKEDKKGKKVLKWMQ